RAVQLVPVEAVVARIEEAARARPGGVVAFDGDGTMWSGDVGDDLWDEMIAEDAFGPAAIEPMRDEARAHAIDASGSAAEVAKRLHEAYVAGTFPEDRIFEMVAWGAAGMTRGGV